MVNKQQHTEELKLRMIDEARFIFARFGYNKATVDEIAKAAGKGKSTFYYYFESKEAVFKAVLEKEAALLRAKLIDAISTNSNALEKIKTYILTRLESFIGLVNFYNAIRSEGYGPLAIVDSVRDKYDMEQANLIKMILLESVSKNETKIDDIELVADAISVILKGLEYHIMFKPENETYIKPKVDKVLDLVFKGLMN